MKKQSKAARTKIECQWSEETFKVSLCVRAQPAAPEYVSLTEFMRRDATCVGNPVLRAAVPDATP